MRVITFAVFVCIALITAGCGLVVGLQPHHEFSAEVEKARAYAHGWIGKEFVDFMKTNPDLQAQIDDGKGGEVYQVKFQSPLPHSTWYSLGSPETNYYAVFKTTYFVNSDGVIDDAVFATDENGPAVNMLSRLGEFERAAPLRKPEEPATPKTIKPERNQPTR